MKYCLELTWLPLNYQTFSYIVLNTCSTGTMVDDGSVSTYTYKQTVPEAGCTGGLLLNNLGYLVSIPTSPLSNCSSLCDLFILHNIFVNKLTSQYRSIIFNGTTIKKSSKITQSVLLQRDHKESDLLATNPLHEYSGDKDIFNKLEQQCISI